MFLFYMNIEEQAAERSLGVTGLSAEVTDLSSVLDNI